MHADHAMFGFRSQDYITPADLQGEGASQKHHFRSPARLSPNRIKRPRNVLGTLFYVAMRVGSPVPEN